MMPDRPAEAEAVGPLYEKYKGDVYRFARHLAMNAGEAEDLFQETWMRVVRHRDEIRSERDMKAWLFTITANLHRDALRRARIRKLVVFAPRPDPERKTDAIASAPAPGPGPDILAEQSEVGQALERALAGLPEKQRRVFVLKEIEGFKHAEIGGILGIPVNTIKTLLFRAMKRLREELRDYGPGSGAKRESGKCDVRTSNVF
jgi:RNA polymerase sigma-70 factor (ECF subfamily)